MKKEVIIILFLVFFTNLVCAEELPDFTSLDLLGRPTENSITINLINGEDSISAYIEYGTQPGIYPYSTQIQNVNSNDLLEFELTNLQPNFQYYYVLKAKNTTMQNYAISIERNFKTKKDNYPFTFTLFTDSHIDETSQDTLTRLETLAMNSVLNDNSDLAFFLGDNIQLAENGVGAITNVNLAIEEYNLFRNALTLSSFFTPSFFTIGNWEGEPGWETQENITIARDLRKKFIPNPNSTTYPEGGSDHEDYYAFTWGNALFIVLNVMTHTEENPQSTENVEDWTLGQEQLDWLNTTLQNSDKPWKFIMIHHTVGGYWEGAYPWATYGRGGGYAAYVGEQAIVHQMMVDNEVQIFFHGHDHVFTNLIVDKIHYIEAGNAGHSFSFIDGYDYYIPGHGRTKVEIISDEIAKVYYINLNEEVLADITIDRLAPRIELIYPAQNSQFRTNTKSFSFTVSDSSLVQDCSLILDGQTEQTMDWPERDTTLQFQVNDISLGQHTWAIKCSDYSFNEDGDYTIHGGQHEPNIATTETRTFKIISNPFKKPSSTIPNPPQIR